MKTVVAGPVDPKGKPRERLGNVWPKYQSTFKQRMEEGYFWQVWLAIQLLQEGLVVQIPQEPFLLNKYENRKIIKDDMDLIIGLNRREWIEIKCKDYDISKFDELYGAERTSWEQLTSKPLAVVVISKKTLEVLTIPTSTEDRWILRQEVKDKQRNQVIDVLMCPKEYLKSYRSLVDTLKSRTDRGYDNVV